MRYEAGSWRSCYVQYSCYYIAGIANETSSTPLIFKPIIHIVNNIMKSLVLNPCGVRGSECSPIRLKMHQSGMN